MNYSRTSEETRAQIAESYDALRNAFPKASRNSRAVIGPASTGPRPDPEGERRNIQYRDLTQGAVSEDVEKLVQARVERITDSNLADCTLIGEDAGNELRLMVYGPQSDDNPLGA